MGSENAHGAHKMWGHNFDFDFFEWYYEDGDEFLSHTIRVTGDRTWVLFVNVETKEQSEVDARTFTKQAEEL
jgi:hypothetical protein